MIWKKIDGFENYSICRSGIVRNDKTGKIKKLAVNSKGYNRVILSKDGKTKRFFLHRLLAIAFIPNPQNKPCVDHINGNRQNNALENLRWCTRSENNRNAKNHGQYKKGVSFNKSSQKFVAKIGINGKTRHLGLFESEDEAHARYCVEAMRIFGEFFRAN